MVLNFTGMKPGAFVGIQPHGVNVNTNMEIQQDGINISIDGGFMYVVITMAIMVIIGVPAWLLQQYWLLFCVATSVSLLYYLKCMNQKLKTRVSCLLESTIKRSRKVSQNNTDFQIYKLEPSNCSTFQYCRHLEFGDKNSNVDHKVIILSGLTGAGKTSGVNTIANHIFGVEFQHSFRFNVIDETNERQNTAEKDFADSSTRRGTAYTFYHQKGFLIPYTLTIIDLPGVGDTKGEKDENLFYQLDELLNKLEEDITAVTYVVPSSVSRFTKQQKYSMIAALRMFPKNLKNNIHLLMTFSNGYPPLAANVLERNDTLKNVQMRYVINNSALFSNDVASQKFFKTNAENLKTFLHNIGACESVKIISTSRLLKARIKFHENLEEITKKMEKSLKIIEAIQEIVQKIKDTPSQNKELSRILLTQNIRCVKLEKNGNTDVLICRSCKTTCHNPCDDMCRGQTSICSMIKNDLCVVCECHRKSHKISKNKYVMVTETRQITLSELYKDHGRKLLDANTKKEHIKNLIDQYTSVQFALVELMTITASHQNIIDQNSLHPPQENQTEYIDSLIDLEQDVSPTTSSKLVALRNMKKVVLKITEFQYEDGSAEEKCEKRKEKIAKESENILMDSLKQFETDEDFHDVFKEYKQKRKGKIKVFFEKFSKKLKQYCKTLKAYISWECLFH